MDEGRIGEILAKAHSIHLVRQYGGAYTGTYLGNAVVRLYLEFCPGGDLRQITDLKPKDPANSMAEEDVWAIFYCLALGVLVMDHGHEDPSQLGWGEKGTEMVHFE